jgi:hypothetical protein
MIGIPLICAIYMIIKCYTDINDDDDSYISTPEPMYTPTSEPMYAPTPEPTTNEYELTLCNDAWVDVNKKMV